jgi:hypothetical protein
LERLLLVVVVVEVVRTEEVEVRRALGVSSLLVVVHELVDNGH